jgi:hypothetical protein
MANLSQQVDVIQADRDAAAAVCDAWRGNAGDIGDIRQGGLDDWHVVQAFARHRLAHSPSPELETGDLIDRVAVAIRDKPESGCGLALDGKTVFCDDPRLPDGYPEVSCDCKDSARAAAGVLSAELEGMRKALEDCVKVIEGFTADSISEGVHAGLRKGTDAPDASVLYEAIARSRTTAWSDACAFAVDPHFTMWGGNEALRCARKALSAGKGEGRG